VKTELFGEQDPIGLSIRLGKLSCQVIGLLSVKGQSGFGQNQDDIVVVPLRTLQRRMAGNSDVNAIMVSARDGVSTEKVQADLERLLRERRKIRDGAEDDFNVRDLKEVTSAFTNSSRVLTALLGAVAAVSLVVGGVGIMNIMLVSVTERTRDRHAPRGRRDGTRCVAAVPGRGGHSRGVWRHHRYRTRVEYRAARDQRVPCAVRAESRHRVPVVRLLRRRRHRVRFLPRPPRRAA
jgi:MacB-like protein